MEFMLIASFLFPSGLKISRSLSPGGILLCQQSCDRILLIVFSSDLGLFSSYSFRINTSDLTRFHFLARSSTVEIVLKSNSCIICLSLYLSSKQCPFSLVLCLSMAMLSPSLRQSLGK
ncbi:hypothetical protein [Phaffia rhodozyma]|uniref:Uncharacterized protein n=1 Tax=Phaffia rhodozyma TaxID=264483 RepID=A0A0F7SJ99_PHARH|nr:hypothetical protein [Phaffia rhodozyma]